MKITIIGLLLTLTSGTIQAENSPLEQADLTVAWQQLPLEVEVESSLQEVKIITGQAQALSEVTELLLALEQMNLFQSVSLVSNARVDGAYHFAIKAVLLPRKNS